MMMRMEEENDDDDDDDDEVENDHYIKSFKIYYPDCSNHS